MSVPFEFEEGFDYGTAIGGGAGAASHAGGTGGGPASAPGEYEEEYFSTPDVPVILAPIAGETGLRLGTIDAPQPVRFLKTPYTESGSPATPQATRWEGALDSGFTNKIADTGWRAADGTVLTADTWTAWPESMRALGVDAVERVIANGGVTYWRVSVRGGLSIERTSATVTLTFETLAYTAALLGASQ